MNLEPTAPTRTRKRRDHKAEGRVLVSLGALLPRVDAAVALEKTPGGRSAFICAALRAALPSE